MQGQSTEFADAGCSGQISACTKLLRAGVAIGLLGSQTSGSWKKCTEPPEPALALCMQLKALSSIN